MASPLQYRKEHFQGKGIPYIDGLDVGNTSAAQLTIGAEKSTIPNFRIPNGGDLYSNEKISTVEVSFTLHDIKKSNLELALRAAVTELAEEAFTDLEVEVLAGRLVNLDRIADITDVQFKPDAGVYRAAVEGTDFERNTAGLVSFVAGTFKLTGTYPAADRTQALTEGQKEYQVTVVFDNELHSGQRVVIKLHKVTFAPLASLDLIGDSYISMEVKGTVLADLSKPAGESRFFTIDKTKLPA